MSTNSVSSLGRLVLIAFLLVLSAAWASAQDPLSFQKSFTPSTIGPGSVSTLRFDITNLLSQPVTGLAFTDNLPAGVTIASPANASTGCQGTISAPDGGGAIVFSDGGVGASSSCSITVDVTSSTPGTHTNTTGSLTSNSGSGGTASADLTVDTGRPGFLKAFSPSSVFFGGRTSLTLTIDNTLNGTGASLLAFIDNLPSGMQVANPSNASTSCPGGTLVASPGSSVISYSGGSVAAGVDCSVSADVIGGSVGTLDNVTGELTSIPSTGGASRSSGKASASLMVVAQDLSLTKSFTNDPAVPGGTVNLEFTIRNLNRRSSASNIAFDDDLDATLSGLAATGTPLSNVCGSGSTLSGTGLLSLSGGNLGPEASCTFSVTLQLPPSVSGVFPNTTSEITAEVDGNPVSGAPASDILVVSPIPILTKEFTDDPVGAGDSATLEFTITNTSDSLSATNIAFVDVLDANLVNATVPAAGFCGAGSTALFTHATTFVPGQLTVSGASLGPSASCAFSFVLEVDENAAGGIIPNTTSEITATVGGEMVTGNPASDDLQVVAAPELTKEFIDDPVVPGGTVTLQFTLTQSEEAVGDATGIMFSDDLSLTLSGLVATGLPQNDVCGMGSQISGTNNLMLSGGTLAPGEQCTFSVMLDVPDDAPSGSYPNTTSSVVATVNGVSATNRAASDDLVVAGVVLSKEFIDDPVLPGGDVTLRFTIENLSSTLAATDIAFSDDLNDTLNNLAATGLPQNDVCGMGSSLTAVSGNRFLIFQGGSLDPQAMCTFDVTLQVPVDAVPDDYPNSTLNFRATIDGQTALLPNAADILTVAGDLLQIAKEFVDDPASAGGMVTLRFTITNLSETHPISDIAFDDDLDTALSGLAAVGLPLADPCGAGSMLSGTSVISLTDGSLAAGGSCTFDVTLSVPNDAEPGTAALNTTSEVTGTVDGTSVSGVPASDTLLIDFIEFSKAFQSDSFPGSTVELSFNIRNLNSSDSIDLLGFTDDLDGVVSGLAAMGLPAADVCGMGSQLDGTSVLTLTGANLLPGGSCTFSVTLQVPLSAAPGNYVNTTSDLLRFGLRVADPAVDTLTLLDFIDEDMDTVDDRVDACPGTVIPEGVPTVRLGVNRFALVDDDGIFDTTRPAGQGPAAEFTITDTAGCSCEQIIEAQHLGNGHTKFGCSLSAMRDWVEFVGSGNVERDPGGGKGITDKTPPDGKGSGRSRKP